MFTEPRRINVSLGFVRVCVYVCVLRDVLRLFVRGVDLCCILRLRQVFCLELRLAATTTS